MPMVRGGDQKRVNVFAGDDLLEVAVAFAVVVLVVLIHSSARLFQVGVHHIADGHHLCVFLVEEVPHVPLSLRSQADAADHNAVARRDLARLAKRRGRSQGRKSGGAHGQPRGLFQETAAGEEVCFHSKSMQWH